MKFFYSALVLFFMSTLSQAQTPYYYTLTEENGLPSSEVYQVKQDQFGFIWLGCDAGLFRYDGIRFKQFNYAKENGRSKSELKFDFSGRLWCQNFTGQLFYVDGDSLILYKDFSKELRSYPQYAVDKQSNVWIATEKCLEKLDVKGTTISKVCKTLNGKDSIPWLDVEITSDGRIYATSYHLGLCEIKPKENSYEVNQISPKSSIFGRMSLELLGSGLYINEEVSSGKKYRIYKYLNNKLTLIADINRDCFVYKVSEDKNGRICLTTSIGVFDYDYELGSFNFDKALLPDDKISSSYQDKEGNTWLTSLQNGIHVIPNMGLYLITRFNEPIQDNYISALTIGDQGNIIAGSYSGKVFGVEEGKSTSIKFLNNGVYRTVKKIVVYKNGYLVSRGVFQYCTKNTEVDFPLLRNARDFCVLNDTIFYITSHASGYFPIKKEITNTSVEQTNPVLIQQKAGRSVVCDIENNCVYIASNDGVFEFKNQTLHSIQFNNERINASKLYFDSNVLWIATVGDGFLAYQDKKIETKDKINNLLKGRRVKTFEINNGILWAATEVCLNKINIQNNTAEYFDLSDGLLSREINDMAFSDSIIYIATNKGIVRFLQNTISVNPIKPSIKLVSVKFNDEAFDLNEVSELDYTKRKVSFKFIATCMRARGNFFYKYRLIGLDTNWSETPAINNEIVFPSLPAGNFVFEVKAVNEDGIESQNVQQVRFAIKKPFWQTWWFYLVIAASGAVLVLIISLLVIKNIRKKAQVRNDLISSQLTAIRAQMNPHFMYNTLNSIQDLILNGDIKNTNYYLSKFSSLMRKILEFSDNEKVVVEEEVEMLQNYLELEKLRFGNDFKFKIEVDEEIDSQKMFIPSLIVQPFVENALKHGLLHKKGGKVISIIFALANGNLIVTIEDNGVGRKRSEEIKERGKLGHKSFASSAVQKRLKLLNESNREKVTAEIIDLYNDTQATGTKVVLSIKM